MSDRSEKIGEQLLTLVTLTMLSGLTYAEGSAMFRAGVFLMEEIDRNPNIDEDFLANKCEELVKQELAAKR